MKKGLGRGLDALFSVYEDDNVEEEVKQTEQSTAPVKEGNIVELDIRTIDPDKNQPRKKFDADSIRELASSIKQHGVISPIIVNAVGNNRYTIVAGERRFRASLMAQLETIPAIIKNYSEKQVKEVALIENLQREDLNPIEAARAIKELMDQYDFTQDEAADRIGKSRPLVANTLRLLSLPKVIVTMIEQNQLSAGHGKCLVAVAPTERQIAFAKEAVERKLSVRDLENLIHSNNLLNVKKTDKPKVVQSIELKEFAHNLQRNIGTKVQIVGDDNKGKIIIKYFSQDDLDRINRLFIDLR